MPMQATTTTPLFSAALKPDNSPRLTGGWVAYGIALVLAAPLAILVPGMLVPAGVAFVVAGAALGILSVRQSRRGRMAEHITLWSDQLEITTLDEARQKRLRRLDPHNVRLILRRDENEKAVAMHLRVDEETIELGRFLSKEDRSSFARAFGTALRQARQAVD